MADRAAIFIDAGNFHYALQKHRWKIDYLKFVQYFQARHDIVRIFYYEGYPTKKMFCSTRGTTDLARFSEQKRKKSAFFKFLKNQGITVCTKPVIRIYDVVNDEYKMKCNFDVELTVDALDTINDYDEVFLCTGDGDFARLVKYLKGKHKIVNVISMKDRLSSLLKKAQPHSVVFLNSIRSEIML